jgi:hypothetical protein
VILLAGGFLIVLRRWQGLGGLLGSGRPPAPVHGALCRCSPAPRDGGQGLGNLGAIFQSGEVWASARRSGGQPPRQWETMEIAGAAVR